MHELVSVIIPVYNIEKYIQKCLLSFKDQSTDAFELVIVNDGSKDGSDKIIKDFISQHKGIKVNYICQLNGGLSAARNTGILNAKGDYIIFLDGDDYVENNFIQLLLSKIQLTGADLVYCGFKRVDESGKVIDSYSDRYRFVDRIITAKELLAQYLKNNIQLYAWNMIIKKEILINNNLRFSTRIRWGEDKEFNPRMLYKCKNASCVDKNLINYVQRADSLTGNAANNTKYIQLIRGLYNFKKMIQNDPDYRAIAEIIDKNALPDAIISILKRWAYCKQSRKFESLLSRKVIREMLLKSLTIKGGKFKTKLFSFALLHSSSLFYMIFNLEFIKKIKKYR